MKIAYQDFLDKISAFENQQLPFVAFRLPNEKELCLIYQNDSTLYPIDWGDKGFVMSSFLDDKSVFIRAENYFTCQEEIKLGGACNQGLVLFRCSDHIALVEKAIEHIQMNDFQKIVLSQRLSIETSIQELSVYFQRLIQEYPSAFCYVFSHPLVGKWAAATPEILLKKDKKKIKTMSLAGTQKVTENSLPSWQEKEKEEQQIVTDTIVKSLEPFVQKMLISETRTIQAGNLWHLCTDISAEIKDEFSVSQIIKSLHPTPAVCGFPTETAKKFILENENYDREFYTGFCGLLNFPNSDTMSVFVNLRCMQILKNQVDIYVGGGITKDSNPEAECQELENKAQTMLKILFS